MQLRYDNIYIGERAREDYGDLKELANDILTNGLIQPLGVCLVDDEDKAQSDYKGEEYALIHGGRRYRAIAEHLVPMLPAEFSEIEVKNFGQVTRIRRLIIEGVENFRRKDMSFLEKVKLVDRLWSLYKLEDPKITKSQVAVEMGVNLSELSRDLQTAAAIKERPALAGAGSRKAVLSAARIADQAVARAARSTDDKVMLDRAKLGQRIVTADMRQWLRLRPDESANVTVVDFPYGQDIFKSGIKLTPRSDRTGTSLSAFNDSPEYAMDLMADAVPEICRTTRLTGWVAAFMNTENRGFLKALFADTCAEHYDYRAGPGKKQCFHAEKAGKKSAGKCRFYVPELVDWIWVRPNSQNPPRYPQLHAKNLYEFIILVNMGKALLEKPCNNVLIHDAEYGSERTHVNQKPLSLYKDIYGRLTAIGDVVVDPAYGSGNSLAAAGSMGRGFYGCDLEPANRDIAVGRVAHNLVYAGDESEREAAKRYERDRAREVEGVDDFSEAEAPIALPRPEREIRPEDLRYFYDEIGWTTVDGRKVYVLNVRNGLHVFFTIQLDDMDKAVGEAMDMVEELNLMAELQVIDPLTATVKEYRDAQRFIEQGTSSSKVEGLPSLRS